MSNGGTDSGTALVLACQACGLSRAGVVSERLCAAGAWADLEVRTVGGAQPDAGNGYQSHAGPGQEPQDIAAQAQSKLAAGGVEHQRPVDGGCEEAGMVEGPEDGDHQGQVVGNGQLGHRAPGWQPGVDAAGSPLAEDAGFRLAAMGQLDRALASGSADWQRCVNSKSFPVLQAADVGHCRRCSWTCSASS